MITIRNTQRTISINSKALQKTVQHILDLLDYTDYDLGIWLTTNKTIQKYNRQYRNQDKPTDILSFPFYPDLKAGKCIKPQSDDDKNLGDLIVSVEYAKQDAKKRGSSFQNHINVLLVHGICHLLGYDHIKDEDYAIMHKKEQALLKKLPTNKY